MLNHFYDRLATDDVVQDVANALAISCGIPVVACDISIVRAALTGAYNYVLAKGMGNGFGRLSNALEDIAGICANVCIGEDLFSADKVLLHIEYSSQVPFIMEEFTGLSAFSKKFGNDVCPVIGVAVDDENVKGDAIVVRLLATNLKRV